MSIIKKLFLRGLEIEEIAIKAKTKALNTFNSDSAYLIENRVVLEKEKHCQKKICEREIEKSIEETNYYISNSKVSTKKSLAILKKHWKIESTILDIDLFLVFKFMN